MNQACVCSDCGEAFQNRSEIYKHREAVHHVTVFKCPLCQYRKEDWPTLQEHIQNVHSKKKKGPAKKRNLQEAWRTPVRMMPELYGQKHSSNIMPLMAQENVMPPTKISKLEDIPPTQINTPPTPPPPTVTPPAPLIPIAKTDQQLTRPTEMPPSPSSTVSFNHSPQINIPILRKIPPPAEKKHSSRHHQ